jgi:TnpA family transposase
VDLAATHANAPILAAVQFLKTLFASQRSLLNVDQKAFPTRFIPVRYKRYLYSQEDIRPKQLLPDRYEFLVYRLLRNGLEAGDLFCRESVRFRSFEDDLVDDQQWQDKATLLAQTGRPILLQSIQEHLAELERQLEERIVLVNQRIAAGQNSYFQIKSKGKRTHWTLHYPKGSEPVNHPVFDSLRQVNIGSLLHFINHHCSFMACFEHILGRYSKQAVDHRVLSACLIAWGTNMGLGRMGEISDISFDTLLRTSENFLRPETLKAANDSISNAIATLPIFRYYDLGAVIHSSSDGQKFETDLPTFNARHSPKYFGLKKGVVAYSLVANHVPVNARIIGAHEHESHYVFDLLFNNTTDIQPAIHSTDTHGTNQVNFALLHLFNYQFAPRHQAIQEKVRTGLYGFQHTNHYGDLIVKPIRKLNTDLIIAEWDNLQRIFVSLALKTTTQSIIVGKLSAYVRKNKTRQALWEYDNIFQSLYLLDFLDSASLRQNVQRALNRGENYHQLRRAVSYANFGKLRFKTEDDQLLWSECSRLITNAVIFYNTMILSRLFAHKEANGDTAGMALITQVSPVAWQHINFYGRYEFIKEPEPINVEAIVETLAQRPFLSIEDVP